MRGDYYVTVTSGMRGYFAMLVEGGCPVQSGIGSYTTRDEAADEAREWAASENIRFVP